MDYSVCLSMLRSINVLLFPYTEEMKRDCTTTALLPSAVPSKSSLAARKVSLDRQSCVVGS
jgi:hypothetical protein